MKLRAVKENDSVAHQVLNIEIVQKSRSNLAKKTIETLVDAFVRSKEYINTHETFKANVFNNEDLIEHVESVQLCQAEESPSGSSDNTGIHLPSTHINYFIYKLNRNGPDIEEISEEGEDAESMEAATYYTLPCSDLQGIWENLFYDSNVKKELLRFVETTMEFADANVDQNVIAANKVVLLHGPPGTGKTSLCKALAQKLSIRMQNRYKHGQLIEINSHSLFSKWFSESGKLVQKMFSKIKEVIDDPRVLVCVLIDEVESLAANRKNATNDCSDAIRAVNALLTQIDSIKHLPNVLILTTSNITGSIDLAFVDRADIRQFIDVPSRSAIYNIFYSCIQELTAKKQVDHSGNGLLSLRSLQVVNFSESDSTSLSLALWRVAEECSGLSGRSLRKLPFLAKALFCPPHNPEKPVTAAEFLEAMSLAAKRQGQEKAALTKT